MRFLIVATVSSHLRAFHLPWVKKLILLGHEVHGAAAGISTCEDCHAAFTQVHEVPFSRSPMRVVAALTAAKALRRIVADNAYDAVHVHTPIAGFVTRHALRDARAAGLRMIYTAHGFHFLRGGSWLKNLIFLGAEKLAARWTDVLCVINDEDYRAAIRHRFLALERIRLVSGAGIDLQKFRSQPAARRSQTRRELGFSAETRVAIVIAELSPVKRHIDAIDALLDPRLIDFCLLLCGDGAEAQRLKDHVAKLRLERRVFFLGFRRDIADLLSASDVCMLVSEREGLPVSVMEAMALSIPVVGTDVRGIRDLLGQGAGFLCEVGDVSGIATALDQAARKNAATEALTHEARRRVEAFSLEKVLNQYVNIYAEVLPRFSSAAPI